MYDVAILLLGHRTSLQTPLQTGIEHYIWECRWCSAGMYLILQSIRPPSAQISVYLGRHLLSTFALPDDHRLVAASAGAAVLHFVSDDSRVPTATCSCMCHA